MSILIRKILQERFMIDEAIASSTITKEEASKPYHIIKYSKDSLGKYAHHHASYDDYNDATNELLKQKSRSKHSFSGYKIVNSNQLKPLVKLIEDNESDEALNLNEVYLSKGLHFEKMKQAFNKTIEAINPKDTDRHYAGRYSYNPGKEDAKEVFVKRTSNGSVSFSHK